MFNSGTVPAGWSALVEQFLRLAVAYPQCDAAPSPTPTPTPSPTPHACTPAEVVALSQTVSLDDADLQVVQLHDGRYVDTEEAYYGESYNVRQWFESRGMTPALVTDFATGTLAAALPPAVKDAGTADARAGVFVVPENERGNFADALNDDDRAALRAFVDDGGELLVYGDANGGCCVLARASVVVLCLCACLRARRRLSPACLPVCVAAWLCDAGHLTSQHTFVHARMRACVDAHTLDAIACGGPVCVTCAGHFASLLNGVFGWSTVRGSYFTTGGSYPGTRAPGFLASPYNVSDAPESLPDLDATYCSTIGSLPGEAKVLFSFGDQDNAFAVHIPFGRGRVLYHA